MSRNVREPDPITTLRQRLRVAEQAASDVVVAMEAFRASLRQVSAVVDDLPANRPSPPVPTPPPKPVEPRPQFTGTRFLRLKTVAELCGLSRTTIWRLERDGQFPGRYRLGANAVGWLADEVEDWIRCRVREASGPYREPSRPAD
jgi:predicted DNA-binding transcriptional regulator AlpA